MKIRHQIKRKAWRRFVQRYPPRKTGDTSIGDALNWEWFIHCGQMLKGRFVLISRANDFGCQQAGEFFLNDQLRQEFIDRVGHKPLICTQRLSAGLKELEVVVTDEEEKGEEDFSSGGSVLPGLSQSAFGSVSKPQSSIHSIMKLLDEQNSTLKLIENLDSNKALYQNNLMG